MNARMMSKSTHSNWKKKPLKKLTCLHFELGPQTPGLVGSSAIFNGAKVFIATTLRAVGTGAHCSETRQNVQKEPKIQRHGFD